MSNYQRVAIFSAVFFRRCFLPSVEPWIFSGAANHSHDFPLKKVAWHRTSKSFENPEKSMNFTSTFPTTFPI